MAPGQVQRGPLSEIILDEIALEGLEGITLPTLWVYLSKSTDLPEPLPEDIKERIWSFIKRNNNQLLFYELPEERETVKFYNRFENIDPDDGVPVVPNECPFPRYKYVPIQSHNIMGSCEHHATQKPISFELLQDLDVTAVLKIWGKKFVIVGNSQLRYKALTPANVGIPTDLTIAQYCVLEAIGRSRYNGETTSGIWSLLNFVKEPAVMFYVKKRLLRLGVIEQKPISEKRNDKIIASTLLTLPRFFTTYASRLSMFIEKTYALLKNAPDYEMTMVDVRNSSTESRKTIKRFMMTHMFRRIFETKSVPFSVVTGKKNPKPNSSGKERNILMLSLRNPNLPCDKLIEDEDDEKDTEEDFYNYKHTFVDMPLKDAFYRTVARHGPRGCSHTEICNYLCINHLTMRQIITFMESQGLIKNYVADVGRQRVKMYVAIEHAGGMQKKNEDSFAALKNLQCAEEPNLPTNFDGKLADVPTISAQIKPFIFADNENFHEPVSQRQIARKAIVVKTIDEKCLMPTLELRNLIQRSERDQGFTDEVCRKSIQRVLQALNNRNIVHVYDIVLQCDELVRRFQYVTHPKIDTDHKVLHEEVLKLKNNVFVQMEEQRLRAETSTIKHRSVKTKNAKAGQKVGSGTGDKKVKEANPLHLHKPPKFLLSRFLHEFLFYIVVELNENKPLFVITEDIVQEWQTTAPDLQVREFLEDLKSEGRELVSYTRELNWRTFIPPLPNYADKPAGWLHFPDAIERMPLSTFNKIFRIEKHANEHLRSYLSHPVRQHFLMHHLPTPLQSQISRVYLRNIYMTVLKLLNNMGLIQITERQCPKDPLMVWVYLNRSAKIIDTTSTEASYSKVDSERTYENLRFKFSTFDDVRKYWTELQRVCIYTKLGFRKGSTKSTGRTELNFVRFVQFDEAPQYDIGEVPGDNLGAAGLSSSLFAHQFRNWVWTFHSSSKQPKLARDGHGAIRSKAMRCIKQSKQMMMTTMRRPHAPAPSMRRPIQHSSTAKRGGGGGGGSKKSATYDAIDRDALKNMRTLRVSWSKEEDHILKMARAVYLYIAPPVLALGLLTVGKICRDLIRHNLGICNKTCQACVRRTHFIVRNQRHLPEVPTWLNLLQINDHFQRRYGEHFIKNLKREYPDNAKFSEALAVHFVLIMNFLRKLTCGQPENQMLPQFMIPNTYEEFQHTFNERLPIPDEQMITFSNPKTEFEVQVGLVLNVLHSSLCSARDKMLYNSQAFEIYKNYSEDILHAAFSKARADSLAVPVKRKNIQLIARQLAEPAYSLSSRYRMRLIFTRINYNVYDAFYTFFRSALETFFGSNASTSQQASKPLVELKSPHAGQVFFLAEGFAQRYWESNIKLPTNILTVDAEQRPSLSSMDRILGHYQNIFENAPQTEYTKNFENEPTEKQVRVKFHPANLSYKIHYSPYDFISKLPVRYLHFFCALDHLQKEVDINFSKLHRMDEEQGVVSIECPFNCILKNANYINAIERIVTEKKSQLNELSEMPPQKLQNLAMSGCSVTIQPTNLLTLVRMLESFWREKELANEQKDLGRMPASMKAIKTIDWQQLCSEILSFNVDEEEIDKNDEYEPTLNKEERIARAQDVFVVNLPILQIGIGKQLREEVTGQAETVSYHGMAVPKILLETDILREAILKKIIDESYWKYVESTFEDLKPKLEELEFSPTDQKHLEDIHNYIESHKLGVSPTDLLREFPCAPFVIRALHTLANHYLIKRVGVATFLYVHKSHMRPWVIHTFHIKRLEREALGHEMATLKRTYGDMENRNAAEDTNDDDEGPSCSKKRKDTEKSGENSGRDKTPTTSGKRTPVPVKRFEDNAQSTLNKTEVQRDVIVMKPHPWMRLNGTINRRVLDRWLGSVLTECIVRTGCLVQDICVSFPHMVPVDIMFLLEMLADLKCIHLTQIETPTVDLFSMYEEPKETHVTELYDLERTYVTAHSDALMHMAVFIGQKKYTSEFI